MIAAAVLTGLAITAVAGANGPPWITVTDDFSAEPVLFGLALAPNGNFIVADADAGAGPTEVEGGSTSLVNSLPGVNDIAPTGRGEMLAVATAERSALYRVTKTRVEMLADTGPFEAATILPETERTRARTRSTSHVSAARAR